MSKALIMPERPSLIVADRSLPMLFPAPAIVHMEAYANGLTALIPVLYAVLDIVSREMVGMLPSMTWDANSNRVAVGELIQWHKSGTFTASDVVASMTVTEPADRTPGTDNMTITDAKKVDFKITGEEQKALGNSIGYPALYQSDFAQALRVLVNLMELAACNEAYRNTSRWTGTPGTVPLATDLNDFSQLVKILDDNGAPGARSVIINSATAANGRKLGQLSKVNESGDSMTLRQGEIGDIFDMSVKQSGQFKGHIKGTNAAATTNAAGYAVGSTVITLASASTGTIVSGDVITFAGDTNNYGVVSGDTDVSNGGTITIAEPGLLVAIPAAATLITTKNSYMQNVAFSQDAMRLLARAPAAPVEGDLRIDEYILTDDRSGLSFEISVWPGQRMVTYQVAICWGVKNVKRAHTAGLMG